MAFSLPLPPGLAKQGWKVKIRDRERVEPPHVTIIRRRTAWRLGLRSGQFLDAEPDPSGVPSAVLDAVRDAWDVLIAEWDGMYPENPVAQSDGEEE